MDAGKRHKTPELETKNSLLLIAVTAAREQAIRSMFPEPCLSWGESARAGTPAQLVGCILEKKPELKECRAFPMASKQDCPLL